MMQIGVTDVIFPNREKNLSQGLWLGLGSSTAYTILIVSLFYFHILDVPTFLAMN